MLLLFLSIISICKSCEIIGNSAYSHILCPPFHFEGSGDITTESLELVHVKLNSECSVSSLLSQNVSNKAVIVFIGKCSPAMKARKIQQAGGKAMILVADMPETGFNAVRRWEPRTSDIKIPGVEIRREVAADVIEELKTGKELQIKIQYDQNPFIEDFYGNPYVYFILILVSFSTFNLCLASSRLYGIVKVSGWQLNVSVVCLILESISNFLRMGISVPPSCFCVPAAAQEYFKAAPIMLSFLTNIILTLYFAELSLTRVFKVATFLENPKSQFFFLLMALVIVGIPIIYSTEFQLYYSVNGIALYWTTFWLGICILYNVITGTAILFVSFRIIQLRYSNVPTNNQEESRIAKRRRLYMYALSGAGMISQALALTLVLAAIGPYTLGSPKGLYAVETYRVTSDNFLSLTQIILFAPSKKLQEASNSQSSGVLSKLKQIVGIKGGSTTDSSTEEPKPKPNAQSGACPQNGIELGDMTAGGSPSPDSLKKFGMIEIAEVNVVDRAEPTISEENLYVR